MQLITFDAPAPHVYIGQGERLRCTVYVGDYGCLAILGEKDAIYQIVQRLIEDRIIFKRFVGLEGRLQST